MRKAIPYIFLFSWLLCACSVDNMLDDWRAGWTAVVAVIIAIVCIIALNGNEK